MKTNILNTLIITLVMIFSTISTASATQYVVSGTTISLLTQSQVESGAHMIQSSKGILNNGAHPWCANRMYINFDDKALYTAALGVWLSGKVVNVIYDDAMSGVLIAGHVSGLQCKVISIF